MRRHALAILAIGLLTLGACGGDDSSTNAAASSEEASGSGSKSASSTNDAIKSAKDCPALIKAAKPLFVDLFQGLIEETKAMSADELANIASDVEGSDLIKDFTANLERDGAALEAQANKLDCSEEDAQEALCLAVKDIDAKGSVLAESMITGMAAECP